MKPCGNESNLVANVSPMRGRDLRRLRGRVSVMVGDEVRDRRIDLVTDAGDDRDLGRGDGAGKDFFVEFPQVFERTTAAREENQLGDREAVDVRERLRDLRGDAGALHGDVM